MEKNCEVCGVAFFKRPRDSARQWADRSFCSLACSNKMKSTMPPHLSFWKYAKRVDGDSCWLWTGVCDQNGYGRISYMTSQHKAHRVSFEMFKGPIGDGMVVMHSCDNPNCVNPDHLEQGTQKQNMMDASKRGRLNPKSLNNLRPGRPGFHGAGPESIGDLKDGR